MLYYKLGNYNLATDIFIELFKYIDWIKENEIDISIEALMNENRNIYLRPDQIIVFRDK